MATHTSRYGLSKPENTDEMQSFMSDYADNMDKIDENLGGGGGSANIVELTQAEYDALPDSKLSDDTMYLIKDANSASDAEFTHVYGLYLDTNNVIYSAFTFDDTEHSWTATSDCILTDNMWAPSNASAAFIRLNGKQVFATYDLDNPFVYVKKGQVVSYRAKNTSIMKAYGVQAGSNVTIIPDYAGACYSTTEREVGCWTDGKPLYQKTFLFHSTDSQGNYVFQDVSSLDIDSCVEIKGTCDRNVAGLGAIIYDMNSFESNQYQTYLGYSAFNGKIQYTIKLPVGETTTWQVITIRYTKTTDVAGSGNWTTLGKPTVHYSTDEQVIGTWINGKPLYQKTVTFTAQSGGYQNVALGVSNADMMYISEAYIISNIETAVLSSYTGNVANEEFQGLIAGLTTFDYRCGSDLNGGAGMVTVRYTKSTD